MLHHRSGPCLRHMPAAVERAAADAHTAPVVRMHSIAVGESVPSVITRLSPAQSSDRPSALLKD
jgi:hypothetical protein